MSEEFEDEFDEAEGDDGFPEMRMLVERGEDGRYLLLLSEDERAVLRRLATDVVGNIEARDDRSTYRLFPPGYSEDLGRQVEYDRLMRDDLQASHIGALGLLSETADAGSLDEGQLYAWVRALNQVRLVLGTRLEITDDDSAMPELAETDPAFGLWLIYEYLAVLQGSAVEALTGSL